MGFWGLRGEISLEKPFRNPGIWGKIIFFHANMFTGFTGVSVIQSRSNLPHVWMHCSKIATRLHLADFTGILRDFTGILRELYGDRAMRLQSGKLCIFPVQGQGAPRQDKQAPFASAPFSAMMVSVRYRKLGWVQVRHFGFEPSRPAWPSQSKHLLFDVPVSRTRTPGSRGPTVEAT